MKNPPFSLFFVLIIVSSTLILSEKFGVLSPIKGTFEYIFMPIEGKTFEVSSFFTKRANSLFSTFQKDEKIQKLQKENATLLSKLVVQESLRAENAVLKEQIGVGPLLRGITKGKLLIQAQVIGRSNGMILDKGKADGVGLGDIAVVENILVGKIVSVSERVSIVLPVNSSKSEILARTVETNAFGVVRGDGSNGVILDNVTLDEKLSETDFVITTGDVDGAGQGFPPNLVIGRIVSIDKKESELFQRAKLESPVHLEEVGVVFLIQY